ncbi:hypothetical protein L596_010013 [Steinernema carpocapsae]|uniref:Uncharacterized protein n=1 Tax=Steinernema carpocapsae TaxID=34508 RepID=A0A4U5PH91_STECR|nr:hypothetical protein L596_010013 [Steinernema carpocapsae]
MSQERLYTLDAFLTAHSRTALREYFSQAATAESSCSRALEPTHGQRPLRSQEAPRTYQKSREQKHKEGLKRLTGANCIFGRIVAVVDSPYRWKGLSCGAGATQMDMGVGRNTVAKWFLLFWDFFRSSRWSAGLSLSLTRFARRSYRSENGKTVKYRKRKICNAVTIERSKARKGI